MMSAGLQRLGIAESSEPVLHVIREAPNEHGVFLVQSGFSGLSFASLVLLGPERSATLMTAEEFQKLVESLASGSVRVEFHSAETSVRHETEESHNNG